MRVFLGKSADKNLFSKTDENQWQNNPGFHCRSILIDANTGKVVFRHQWVAMTLLLLSKQKLI